MAIHDTAEIENSTLGDVEVREFATIHDSELAAGARIFERTSIKRSTIGGPVDVNANCFLENVRLGDRVQIGPNAAVVGVTHDLGESGMEFRNDQYDEVVVEDGAFVGAGAVVLPGVTVGEDAVVGAGTTVTEDVPSGCVVRSGAENVVREL